MGENHSSEVIRIEISSSTLARLLQHTALCAAEVRSLDSASKDIIWRLCLESSLKH